MRAWVVLTITLFLAIPSTAQTGGDLDALLDAFYSRDLDTVARYVPEPLENALLQSSEEQKRSIASRVLYAESMKLEGLEAARDESGQSFLVVRRMQDPSQVVSRVTLLKHICDGTESLLRFEVWNEFGGLFAFEVWMRFAEGRWRVYEIQRPGSNDRISLDSEELVERIRKPQVFSNEQKAVLALRNYARSIEAFIEINGMLPASLDRLAPKNDEDGTHFEQEDDSSPSLPWIQPELVTSPFEYSGYRFQFQADFSDAEPGYAILARPLEQGVTGRKSYYLDRYGRMHFTYEDRDASGEDPIDGTAREAVAVE
jgi:hypothetical protein